MNAVIGGWVAGYAMAIALNVRADVPAAFQPGPAAVRPDADRPRSSRTPPRRARFIGTGVIWTMIGLVLGSVYVLGGFADKPGALGSAELARSRSSWASLALLPVPVLVSSGRGRLLVDVARACRLAFAGLFGWLMPLLAER